MERAEIPNLGENVQKAEGMSFKKCDFGSFAETLLCCIWRFTQQALFHQDLKCEDTLFARVQLCCVLILYTFKRIALAFKEVHHTILSVKKKINVKRMTKKQIRV